MDFAALKTELQTDPAALGYAPLLAVQDWTGLAAKVNALHAGFTIAPGLVASYRIVGAIVKAEFDALAAADKTYLNFIVQPPDVDVSQTSQVRTALGGLFGAGTATRSNLVALASRPGRRAEELFGLDVKVTVEDCIRAIRGSI
jgi:hypothetical protein